MDDLLTVKQAAILLKVHPLTVRRYINGGKLKALRLAGNVRISQQELRSFIEIYTPSSRSAKPSPSNSTNTTSTTPFAVNDPFFRLKGRGLSLDNLNR